MEKMDKVNTMTSHLETEIGQLVGKYVEKTAQRMVDQARDLSDLEKEVHVFEGLTSQENKNLKKDLEYKGLKLSRAEALVLEAEDKTKGVESELVSATSDLAAMSAKNDALQTSLEQAEAFSVTSTCNQDKLLPGTVERY